MLETVGTFQRTMEKEEQMQEREEKKLYEKPELVEYENLTQLTAGALTEGPE